MAEAANVAEREMAFTAEQGRRTASARRAGASAQADSMSSQGESLLISGVGKVGNDNNWWGIGQWKYQALIKQVYQVQSRLV